MTTYIIRRALQSVIVILVVSFLCFVFFQYLGDPVEIMAGKYGTKAQKQELKKVLGLDKPFYIQYGIFLKNAVRGDFGLSYSTQAPVSKMILERLPASVELALTAVLFSVTIGLIFGVTASLYPKSWISRLIMGVSLLGISLPTFLVGVSYLLVFSVWLDAFPSFGRGEVVPLVGYWKTGFLTLDGIHHLLLPGFTLGMYYLAVLTRLVRSGMLEVLEQDYIRTALAKGLHIRKVVFKHAMRNMLIPVVTILGLEIGSLIAFSVVTETIFQWPGTGQLLITSLLETDRPVIVAYVMFVAVLILVINFLVDILYGIINPRVTYD